MFSKNIKFQNYKFTKIDKTSKKVKKDLSLFLKENSAILQSLGTNYKNSYNKNLILKLKKFVHIRIIGMGGSTLGAESIYNFLKHKIKKKFNFINNLQSKVSHSDKKKNYLNLIISKSGNTLETISNANVLIKGNNKNVLITENKKSYLFSIAKKLKAEIVNHNNLIGGRYSVLSEVGMLPAELMGLDAKKFKQMQNLVKNKKFVNALTINVNYTLHFLKQKKFNSIILNYDEKSDSLFKWYQQLVAESLGKKGKGIFPIISSMPKDNHSLMQFYLDGPRNNFFTFFYVKEDKPTKINNKNILNNYDNLKNKNLEQILHSQKIATENVFQRKKIPFRSFEIANRSEEALGELFCFFVLETILIARALKINPYDQPSVEWIKKETKKILF
tara:strand:- start:390 stop:1556 length:1167 start_codon:yes stop_codon:yes gene_type:complete